MNKMRERLDAKYSNTKRTRVNQNIHKIDFYFNKLNRQRISIRRGCQTSTKTKPHYAMHIRA